MLSHSNSYKSQHGTNSEKLHCYKSSRGFLQGMGNHEWKVTKEGTVKNL